MSQGEMVPQYDPVEDSRMGLFEHLNELRIRLIWIVGALLIGTIVSFLFVERLLAIITEPVGESLIAIGPTDTIGIFFRVGFVAGAVIAMPVIVYQMVAFIAPGLYPHEKRMLFLILPGVMLLFVIGAWFAFKIMLPVATGFLQNFLGSVINQEWTIDRYVNFVTRIVFWIGVFFETPLVIAFLARIGLVTGPSLLSYWRQAMVGISVIAAIITPTVDPVNMAIVMLPLIVLYFLGVGLAYILYRPREPRDFSD
ncbi:MAG: twin-arginine translocase subunit TatC [Caldilineaceae bacterium]|nr:twin-arginine translocase subunit TatC [Caldilineaceae bacterium]